MACQARKQCKPWSWPPAVPKSQVLSTPAMKMLSLAKQQVGADGASWGVQKHELRAVGRTRLWKKKKQEVVHQSTSILIQLLLSLWFPLPLVSVSIASARTDHSGSLPSTPGQATSFGPQQLHTPPSLSQPAALHCTLPPTHEISQGKLAVSSHADEFPWGKNQTHTPRRPEDTHCTQPHVPEASQIISQLQSSAQACSLLNFLARFTAAACVISTSLLS